MSDRLKALRDKQAKIVADARAKLDEIKPDTDEVRAKEIEAEYDKIMADYDALDAQAKTEEEREKKQRDLEDKKAKLEAVDRSRRPGQGSEQEVPGAEDDDERAETDAEKQKRIKAERAAFVAYLRHGEAGVSRELRAFLRRAPREARAQGTQDGPSGGYLVPEGFMAELIKVMKIWGPMLDETITRVLRTATGNPIPWPTMDDTGNEGVEVPENSQVQLTEVIFGIRTLEAYKYSSGIVPVSSELMQDSALDIEGIVRDAMGERIGRIGNRRLTTGSGASQPNGIATAAAVGIVAAAVNTITADELIDLEHSVDAAYRGLPSVRWMWNDLTLKAVRKLKDGEGRYLWQPADLRAGQPNLFMGYPYSVNNAMAILATGNRTVVFGAFEKYVTRIVLQFAVRRLVERYADLDQTAFIGFMRLDGDLMDVNAVKVLAQA